MRNPVEPQGENHPQRANIASIRMAIAQKGAGRSQGLSSPPVQRKATDSATNDEADGDSGNAGGGSGGDGMLDQMGAAFGADFSNVQIHHGDGEAEAMGAEATAQGDDIHVAAHRSPADKALIAHELAHVVQQREARVSPGAGDAVVENRALEDEADRAGEAVASGQPVPADARAQGGAAAGADAPIQLNRDPLKGIDLYLKVNEVPLWAALKEHLGDVPWPSPHPHVEWLDSRFFGQSVWAALKDQLFMDEPVEIAKLVFPANHRDVLRAFLPSFTKTWLPGIGRAFAELIEDATRASLRRLGPRYAAVAAEAPAAPVEYSQLVKSHPIDRHVARSLVRKGVARYAQVGKPDKATKPRALQTVKYEWQGDRDPTLWNWVKADKADATVEDVAASLYPDYGDKHPGESGSTLAYALTPAPPLFGLPSSWALAFKDAKKHAPANAAAVTDRGPRIVALAASKVDDEIAVAQNHVDATKAPTPKAAALAVTLGDSLIAAGYLHRSLLPWNQAPAINTTIAWIRDKQSQVATMPAKDLGTWGPIIEGQKDRLKRIVGGVKGVVDKTAGLGVKDTSSPGAKPLSILLSTFAQAAALSHLADTGEQLIADATQQQQQLAVLMLRGVTNDMSNAVGVASQANQRGIADLSSESLKVAADAQNLQNQLAAGVPVDSAAIEETTLHAQEIAFKTRVQGLYWSIRSLKIAVEKAGSGLTSHIAKHFHGSFKTLERAIVPVEGTINTIIANQQGEDATIAGGNFETPADNRALRRLYLKNNTKIFDELTSHTDLVEFLREGADTVQWQQFATGCVQIAALIGISIVAGAAGSAVVRVGMSALGRVGSTAAVAEIAEGGGMLARAGGIAARSGVRLAGAATEAGITTAAQIKLQGGKADEAFFANLLSTIGANAILGTLTKDLAVARSIEMRTAGHWAKRAGKVVLKETVAISAHTIMNVAIGYLAHMVVTREKVTAMMARDWLMQGISTGVGRYVGGFMKSRKAQHEKLGKLPESLGGKRLLTSGEDLAALAKHAESKPGADAAQELLAKRAEVLQQELEILEKLEKNPELLTASPDVKLTIKDVREAIKSIRAEQGRLVPQSRRLVLEAAGLEEIVPNSEYRGSADQLRRVMESAHAVGLEVGPSAKSGNTTRVKIGDVEIVFHEGAATASAPPPRTHEEQFLEDVRSKLDPIERAKFDKMVGKRKPKQVYDEYGGNVEQARKQVVRAIAAENAKAASALKSIATSEQIRQWADDIGLMNDARPQEIIKTLDEKLAAANAEADPATRRRLTAQAKADALADLRSHVIGEHRRMKLAMQFPRSRVRRDVQVWQEQHPPAGEGPYTSVADYKTRRAAELKGSKKGVKLVDNQIYLEITDFDMLVTMDQPNGKGTILHTEEIKTGANDSPDAARGQLNNGINAIHEAASGRRKVILFEGGTKDVTGELDLASMHGKPNQTRGPEGKGFESSLDISSADLDAMIKKLLDPPPKPAP
jgi:hypothetical protein